MYRTYHTHSRRVCSIRFQCNQLRRSRYDWSLLVLLVDAKMQRVVEVLANVRAEEMVTTEKEEMEGTMTRW